MTVIRQEDLIQSVADALQYISYYHPMDYIAALGHAYEQEQGPAAKDAIAQILTNNRMCAEDRRPICRSTDIVTVFLKVGTNVRWENENGNATISLEDMVNEDVRHACSDIGSKLRAGVLADPAGKHINTKDNTPAVINMSIVPGDTVDVIIIARGGGLEAESKSVMLNPPDSIVDWMLKTVPIMGTSWCPPGMLGIDIGGMTEEAMLLAKEALMEPTDTQDLIARGPSNRAEELRVELYEKVNVSGVGAQGLNGPAAVLGVKILDYLTYTTNLLVVTIPSCATIRHAHFAFDNSGVAKLEAPDLSQQPKVEWASNTETSKCVSLNMLMPEEVVLWKSGQTFLPNGKMLTGHDAAHKHIADTLAKGEKLPIDLISRVVYYVGPVDPVRDEVAGPAGPTTATRTNKFTKTMLAQTDLIAMVGKAEHGPAVIGSVKKRKPAYLTAVGGAAYLVSKAIRGSKVLAFEDLDTEAIYEFDVKDIPATVAVDSSGTLVHKTGPAKWQAKVGKVPIAAG